MQKKAQNQVKEKKLNYLIFGPKINKEDLSSIAYEHSWRLS